jgi:hypothetical protein
MKQIATVLPLVALLAAPVFCFAGDGVPASATNPMWDAPLGIDSLPASYVAGPVWDSNGNAWVAISDSANLIAVQSNGTSGTWKAPHIIGPYAAGPAVGVAVDNAGGFYVTWGTGLVKDSPTPLMLAKYTPSGGWQSPAVIFTSSTSFQKTYPAIDSTGRLVVTLDLGTGISSIASNPAQTSWGSVQMIVPPTGNSAVVSVAANKSGARLALVYLPGGAGSVGLRFSSFNSSTALWSAPTLIAGSLTATFSAGFSYPLAVDETGNVTFLAPVTVGRKQWSVGGFRYESGKWTETNLTSPSGSLPAVDLTGSIVVSPTGVVLAASPLSDGNVGINITAFRYTSGQGWDTELVDHFTPANIPEPCQVAWFESTEPVVTYGRSINPAPPALTSAIYSNGAWGPGPPISGNFTQGWHMAAAPTGEDLLVILANGTFVTFLRP